MPERCVVTRYNFRRIANCCENPDWPTPETEFKALTEYVRRTWQPNIY